MRLLVSRMIAIMLLVIPGLIATYGFLMMKNTIFEAFGPPPFSWLKFLAGLAMFALGIAFLGGWIFYRDRKRNYLAPRFRPKRGERRPRPTAAVVATQQAAADSGNDRKRDDGGEG